ncbi:hypothetical protein, partial [Mycolicibacterium sphagni]|uniref:hypothetical protein n=1 Tax=Mycolicibacterium sphagni TaxID=1786 RepID=UPI0021F39D9E
MTAPQPSVSSFFSGGGNSVKFPTPGSWVRGTITAVHPPEQQTDFESKLPIPGKFQIRIDLATDQRDPSDQYDDGARTLFVKGWMTGAIGDACKRANVKEPAVGGTLQIVYTGDGTPTRPGLQGPKQFSAEYVPPPVTAGFFGGQPGAPAPAAPQGPPPLAPPAPAAPGYPQQGPPPGYPPQAPAPA